MKKLIRMLAALILSLGVWAVPPLETFGPVPPTTTTTTTVPPTTTTTHYHPPTTTTAPAPPPAPSSDDSVWYRLRECEAPDWAGGWQANTGNGYYGGLQFALSSWQAVGGTGYPHQASVAEQIKRGKMLQATPPHWGHWPACSKKLGLR